MEVLSEIAISILKLSKNGPVLHESVKKEARLPLKTTERLLQTLQNEGLIYLQDGLLQVNTLQRVSLAVLALRLGADYERVSNLLLWKEFESLVAATFEALGYEVKLNLRFKAGGRRWEIDVIGCRRPLIVCVDCKQWRRGFFPSKLETVVKEQVKRTEAFSRSLPNPDFRIKCVAWEEARLVPVVVSLVPGSFRFYEGVPVVPIMQLKDFLYQLPMCTSSLKRIDWARPHLKIA